MKLNAITKFIRSKFPKRSVADRVVGVEPSKPWPRAESDGNVPPLRNPGPYQSDNELHVIAVYFNHHGFENPRKNFRQFVRHMSGLDNVVLHIVELVVRDMPFEVTDEHNERHTRLRTDHELFHKENLVNIGVAHLTKLYPDWKYVAWVDADVKFMNPNIVADTIRACNRYNVVQMWGEAIDLGPSLKPLRFPKNRGTQYHEDILVSSFGYCFVNMVLEQYKYTSGATTWHPGYAWAMRREIWDKIGGLLDISILGAGDHHMAWAFVGKPMQGIHGAATQSYKDECFRYLKNASAVVAHNLGYVDGLILHYWHGRKSDRKYVERWEILVGNKFDPKIDLVRREDGLLQLTPRSSKLRDDIRKYFLQRNEDANTIK